MALETFPAVDRKAATPGTTTPTLRRKRKDSTLGADPRGDTGAISIATSGLKSSTPPPSTPVTLQTSKERGRKRRKARRLLSRWKRTCLRHTWLVPLILTLTILSLYGVYPYPSNPLHAAIFLSYANPPLNQRTVLPAHVGDVTQYGQGWKDFAFVGFYTIVLSFTREFLMQRLIRPIAIRSGIRNRGKISRFMEQFYTAIYFSVAGPVGIWIMSRTPVWYFNTAGMYADYPHRAHEGYFKAYYLLQAAYWAQQAIVLLLMLEKPRKDFKELVVHHIVTLALIGLSYRFHFTYMGIAVYVTHDISDFFLATSKVLNYLDHPLTIPYFALFIVVWAYMRHFINLRIIYSLFPYNLGFGTANEFATVGPYIKDMASHQYKCWISQVITCALLVLLQLVNLFWFFLIFRILYRYIFTNVVKDERSDDEEEEEEEVVVEGVPAEKKTKAINANGNGEVKKPQVVLNGEPIEGDEIPVLPSSNRKATLRKRG